MATAMIGSMGELKANRWLPLALGAVAILYMVGYLDGAVHGAALGSVGAKAAYLHEFFHHARHVALMCH